MEMDQVYAELAPQAGKLRELRAEADAYRAARMAKPNRGELFGPLRRALKAAAQRFVVGKPFSVSHPIKED